MNVSESVMTGLGHLEMIMQAARGEYSPREGELEKRQAAIVSLLRTGQCLASDEDRAITAKVREALTEVSEAAAVNG